MSSIISKLFRKKKCFICNQKAVSPQYYLDDQHNKVAVCYKCIEYAERRAMPRFKWGR
ncbi:hypothetical protein SAMN05216225_100311 [Ornithinibacillus halophilus]|uniref:Uncharacterized protein n=1 Tax=Ornithinibacillus halophilus TaxID=930117 RepID=A0A1M5DUF4_9BACI|nr:hypothetical protein SAMN05216225_100311 [Ornithinibacillus halophilus]